MGSMLPIPPDAPVWFASVLALCCLALLAAIWLPRLRVVICAAGFLAALILGPGTAMLIGAVTALLTCLVSRPAAPALPAMICVFLGSTVAAIVLLATAAERGWPSEAGYLAAAIAGFALAIGFSEPSPPVMASAFSSSGLAAASADMVAASAFVGLAILIAVLARKDSLKATRGVIS
tara:strand:+ start:1490 stop:2023 length:534 start_codon:yes stop_codon:yes gene_type:complete